MLSYSAYPIITLPTRVTDHSTITDHIICNDTLRKITPGILRNDSISDHFQFFVIGTPRERVLLLLLFASFGI